jgi:pyrroloquinoline quinone biosynthesis protein B
LIQLAGPEGSLERLSVLPIERRTYIHINNTNPILPGNAQERCVVEERGMKVAMGRPEVQV